MKRNLSNAFLFLVFIAGLSLLLYPSLSDYWNSLTQSRMVASYMEDISSLDDTQYQDMLDEAIAYNEWLAARPNVFVPYNEEEQARYEKMLDVSGTGIMGYVNIPGINCQLPIYHGTDDGVLQVAIGHIDWSSLPVGGPGTHVVISGHRGLPSARLFTDLDRLREGDIFYLDVLGDTLTYEVDRILTVLPEEVEPLRIAPGEDYCTLVTCTPYGINSHRLLVRGHRVDTPTQKRAVRVTADAYRIEAVFVAPFVAIPMLVLLLILLLTAPPKKPKTQKRN